MSDNETKSYFRYWGKASPKEDGSVNYHLLPYHCLDVAAVGHVWWYHSPSLRAQSVRELNIPEKKIYSWMIFFMALHDYGKFDVRFQMKIPELAKKVYPKPPSNNPDKNYKHGDGGFMWFVQDVEELVSEKPLKINQKRHLENWLQKTAGHHGKIPVDTEIQEPVFTAPKIKAGQRILFSLRVNPIRTKRDENNRQHRHDVVMERKDQLKKMGTPKEKWQSLNQLAQEEGCKWLKDRVPKHGFSFDEEKIIVEHYSRHCFYKSKGKNRKGIKLSTLDFNGALTVEDPSLFLETLNKGVGPAKGFGCGLMLVRRV